MTTAADLITKLRDPNTTSKSPVAGLWVPRPIQGLFYGPNCVQEHLIKALPSESSKAFIITGNSLATKTPLIKQVEALLGSRHAGTFSKIGQHAPVAQLDEATDLVHSDTNIDTLISIGGGSPIDSAKAISARNQKKHGNYLHHITIPTTLSAAECTQIAGYTKEDGMKTGVSDPKIAVDIIFYDPGFAKYTPQRLWLSTGIRALDHATETMYHPAASEVPSKLMALGAITRLFELLPKSKDKPEDEDILTQLFLATYASLGFLGLNIPGGLGLSHKLGYALGSPYGISHGETSCLTLGHVVKLKAARSKEDAEQIARILPRVGGKTSGNAEKDAQEVGNKILKLVEGLGLKSTLTEKGVDKDQLDTITSRATGTERENGGDLYDSVRGLVEGLW